MRNTEYYHLNKPESGDQYNISHFNDNSDIIDTALHNEEVRATGVESTLQSGINDAKQFSNMQGVAAISQGGTGETTAQNAINALHGGVNAQSSILDTDEITYINRPSVGVIDVKSIALSNFKSNIYANRPESRGDYATYDSNIAPYNLGAVLWYPAGGYFVQSLIANNTNPNLNDTTAWAQVGVASKNIGEVFFSESNLAADNPGALPLFTGETISNADELYPSFYEWVRTHSALQISAADYATAISTYGECAKYVIDTVNKTITLPLLKNFVKMANTTDGITEGEAGLPNITASTYHSYENFTDLSGAFYTDTAWNYGAASNAAARPCVLKFDASLSNPIYGNSNTVTPPHTTLYPWVFAFNVSVPASMAQAAEFQDALSGKVDLASGVAQADVDYVIESYVYGTSWKRIYKSGWCEQGGQTNIASGSGNYSLVFLEEFADTNYNFLCQPEITDTSTTYADRIGVYRIIGAVYSKATTGVQIQYDSSTFTGKFFWRAEGYLAS